MKKGKKLLGIIGVAYALVACESHSMDDVETMSSENAIQVGSTFIYRGTRASGDITSSTMREHEFKVWAHTGLMLDVFNGQTFAWDGECWSYSPTMQWNNRTIHFAALAPTESNGGIPSGEYSYAPTLKRFSIYNIPIRQTINNGDVKSGLDYLVSEILSDRTQVEGDLQFSFHHILTKLKTYVCFRTDGQISEATLTQLQLLLPTGSAIYQQSEDIPGNKDVWTLNMGESSYVDLFNNSNINLTTEYMDADNAFFLVPNEDIEVKMNISFKYKNVVTSEVTTKEYKEITVQGLSAFRQGQLINLYISVQPGQLGNINFRASTSNWEENENSQQNL